MIRTNFCIIDDRIYVYESVLMNAMGCRYNPEIVNKHPATPMAKKSVRRMQNLQWHLPRKFTVNRQWAINYPRISLHRSDSGLATKRFNATFCRIQFIHGKIILYLSPISPFKIMTQVVCAYLYVYSRWNCMATSNGHQWTGESKHYLMNNLNRPFGRRHLKLKVFLQYLLCCVYLLLQIPLMPE